MSKQITATIEVIKKASKPRFVTPSEPVEYAIFSGCLKITFPVLPPSKNLYIRLHWRALRERFFKPWERMMLNTVGNAIRFKGKVTVEIELHYPDNRNRDPLNYTSFPPLMDCLVKAGILEDDNYKVCRIVTAEPIIDGTRRTVIRIRPMGKETDAK